MEEFDKLQIGDLSTDGKIQVIDKDRLCYVVRSESKGAYGLRTLSKQILGEFIQYFRLNPDRTANEAREALCGSSDLDKFEYGYCATLTRMAKMVLWPDENLRRKDGVTMAHNNGINKSKAYPLQQITYGAPGTGKSHKIKEITEGKEVIRTTFHPDTDYSNFVGAYKPTTVTVPVIAVVGNKTVAVEDYEGNAMTEEKIVYRFVSQSFLQAYVTAWKKYAAATEEQEPEDVFLIIEEINRGNCAQIFGDLFQLLDRGDEGFSEYPIKADVDMKKYLAKEFEGLIVCGKDSINALYKGEKDIVAQVLRGDILLLPNNLYIWATMNTSDQSLFPIDSAFKRRWEWQYVPIGDAGLNWVIEVAGGKYDWWQFLSAINTKVFDATFSEDKKLGYFFCKSKNGIVDAKTFVGKVIFYLWNDVFKDEDAEIFKLTDSKPATLDLFYKEDEATGSVVVDEEMVASFLKKLGLNKVEEELSDNVAQKADWVVYVNGVEVRKANQVPYTVIEKYVEKHPEMTAQEVINVWERFKKYTVRRWIVANKEEIESMEERYANYSYPIKCNDGSTLWVNKDGWMHHPTNSDRRDTVAEFIKAVNDAGFGITVTEESI